MFDWVINMPLYCLLAKFHRMSTNRASSVKFSDQNYYCVLKDKLSKRATLVK